MAGRYLTTGTQIGMLKTLEGEEKLKVIKEIEDNQFIGNSANNVKDDAKEMFMKY